MLLHTENAVKAPLWNHQGGLWSLSHLLESLGWVTQESLPGDSGLLTCTPSSSHCGPSFLMTDWTMAELQRPHQVSMRRKDKTSF